MLWGCIAALDGIPLPIKKPLDRHYPRHYFTRKGFNDFPVEAMCDSPYRFLYMSANCVGSTYDSLVWACSALGAKLVNGLQLGEYWIAGDAAYICTDSLVTPFNKS
jgi:hypothetical protein